MTEKHEKIVNQKNSMKSVFPALALLGALSGSPSFAESSPEIIQITEATRNQVASICIKAELYDELRQVTLWTLVEKENEEKYPDLHAPKAVTNTKKPEEICVDQEWYDYLSRIALRKILDEITKISEEYQTSIRRTQELSYPENLKIHEEKRLQGARDYAIQEFLKQHPHLAELFQEQIKKIR